MARERKKGQRAVHEDTALMLDVLAAIIIHCWAPPQVAERNTWPKMEMITSHCAVEMELEQCVQAMRRQLTTEHQVFMLSNRGYLTLDQ